MLRREPVVHGEHVRPGTVAEEPARRVVGVQIAHDEPATVEKQDQGSFMLAFFCRRVESGGERPRGAVYREVPHGPHRSRRSVRHGDLGPERRPRLGRRKRFQGRRAPTLQQREAKLYFGFEGLAVHVHGWLPREPSLNLRRQRGEQAGDAELQALAGGEIGLWQGFDLQASPERATPSLAVRRSVCRAVRTR